MDSQAVEATNGWRDTALYWVSAALFIGGLFAFSYFDPELAGWVRALLLVAAVALAGAALYPTAVGESLKDAIMGARGELRKVTWPTRREAVQMSLLIGAFVLLMSLIIWGLDSLLLWGVETLTGRNQ